ncbi:MAG: DoxX family protein, partial [Verrucomicrobiota bacterium]
MISFLPRLLFATSQPHQIAPGLALLLLRLHVGLSMARGGADKLPVPDWFIEQVSGLGFPLPGLFAFLAALAEFAGGILLAIGLFTRPAAFFLAVTIGVAAFGFHQVPFLLNFHITQTLFWSYVVLTFIGGGRFALDRLIVRPYTETETA